LRCFICDQQESYYTTYSQNCCIENAGAIYDVNKGAQSKPLSLVDMTPLASNRPDGGLAKDDAIIYGACCCTLESCLCSWPECCGCYNKGAILCIENEFYSCKAMCCVDQEIRKDKLCIFRKGNYSLVYPYTCCANECQFFFVDHRDAFPCDDEVPCVWTILPGLVVCANYKCQFLCCPTINAIKLLKNGGARTLPEK